MSQNTRHIDKDKEKKSSNSNPGSSLSSTSSGDTCVYCLSELGSIWIVCEQCHDFSICLKCFSMSAEIGEHKKEHDYRVRSSGHCAPPCFDSDKPWSYKEEIELMNALEHHGFANWLEIAKSFDSPQRTPAECMQHYTAYYIYGNIGKYTFKMATSGDDRSNVDHTKESEITILLPPIEMSPEEQRALGYMPLRDDFEREYKNDAETLLSNLVMSPTEDDETDVEIKLTLIKMYRQCLAERQRLKKIARQYGLINNASALINKNRLELGLDNQHGDSVAEPTPQPSRGGGRKLKTPDATKTTGDSHDNKFKKFAQFCSVSCYETLLENMRKAPQLIARIGELQRYRESGLKKFDEIAKYDKDKQERESAKKQKKRTLSTSGAHCEPPAAKRLHLQQAPFSKPLDLDISCDSNTSSCSSTRDTSSASSLSNDSLDNNLLSPLSRLGRGERLCSMPGYNLLSDNEKKTHFFAKYKAFTLYIF